MEQLEARRSEAGRDGPLRHGAGAVSPSARTLHRMPGNGWRCWWTSTTSRSWTRWWTRRSGARQPRLSARAVRGDQGLDAHVRFTFLTGVSKFSKVSLFSELNNLTDLTLDPVYSSICGYTEGDLDTVFAPGAGWTGPGAGARVVQRLPLAGRGEGVQPVRRAAAVPHAASSRRTGSRPGRRRSWWRRCSSGGWPRCRWTRR